MRIRPRLAAIVLTIVLFVPFTARAQSETGGEPILRNARQVRELVASRVQRLGTSAGPDPDTVYVGKSFTDHTAPDNYWNIHTGTYLPGVNVATNTMWGWDNTVGIQAPDSLQGWWPLRRQYNQAGGLTLHGRSASVVGDRSRQPRELRHQPAVLGQAHVRRGRHLARGRRAGMPALRCRGRRSRVRSRRGAVCVSTATSP